MCSRHFLQLLYATLNAVPAPRISLKSTSSSQITLENTNNTNVYVSGSSLTITCDITVSMSVNTNFAVLVQWSVKLAFLSEPMTGSGDSTNVLSTTQATKIASKHYQSQLTISSLSRTEHTGNYTCAVTLDSSDTLLFVDDSSSTSVTTTVEINGIYSKYLIHNNCNH